MVCVPLPEPLAGADTSSHVESLTAIQLHPLPVLTTKLPLPPVDGDHCLPPKSENWQLLAAPPMPLRLTDAVCVPFALELTVNTALLLPVAVGWNPT